MTNIDSASQPPKIVGRATLRGHLAIARVDHWFKNVFIIPRAVAAAAMDPQHLAPDIPKRAFLGLASVCLVASSNYVINQVLGRAIGPRLTRPSFSGRCLLAS
jgi:4-hydroxybenzoate polyprenyltransferase